MEINADIKKDKVTFMFNENHKNEEKQFILAFFSDFVKPYIEESLRNVKANDSDSSIKTIQVALEDMQSVLNKFQNNTLYELDNFNLKISFKDLETIVYNVMFVVNEILTIKPQDVIALKDEELIREHIQSKKDLNNLKQTLLLPLETLLKNERKKSAEL